MASDQCYLFNIPAQSDNISNIAVSDIHLLMHFFLCILEWALKTVENNTAEKFCINHINLHLQK